MNLNVFLALMIFSAGLSFVRILSVAAFLIANDFSTYAVIISLGAFLSYMLSFGKVEATVKLFPRDFVNNDCGKIYKNSASIIGLLSIRSFLFLIVFLFAEFIFDFLDFFTVLCLVLIALMHALVALVASVLRALGNLFLYAFNTLFRAIVSVVSVIAVAFYTKDLALVLVVEVAAVLFGFVVSWIYLRGYLRKQARYSDAAAGAVQSNKARKFGLGSTHDERLLFFSYAMVSMPFYLDRFFVSSIFNEKESAQYAVLAVFLSGAILIVNTISQKIGPDSIKEIAVNGQLSNAYFYVLRWASYIVVGWFLTITTIAFAFYLELVPSGLTKYNLQLSYFAVVGVLGGLHVTSLFEFLLLGQDKEKEFFSAAFVYFIFIILMSSFVYWFNLEIIWFFIGLIACRILYFLAILYNLRFLKVSVGRGV